MVEYVRHQLSNGLVVLVHRDPLTPMVVTNVVYNAGSKFDPPHMTGMAHLLEHLMFGGSKNAPSFDTPQQLAGGENNAYTNADITNYFQVLPGKNLDVALWLESDRMGFLNLDEKTFHIQKSVVLEEYNETCLNEPYGDVWHYIHHLAYKKYPYKWPTIGLTPEHIAGISLDEVKRFYKSRYRPDNAVLSIAGNVDEDKALRAAEKWFEDLPSEGENSINLGSEPKQKELRRKELIAMVPHPAVYMAFHIPDKVNQRFPSIDLLSDLLGLGRSCRLNEKLVEEMEIFSAVDAYVNGANDMGLFIIEGKLNEGFSSRQGEQAIWEVLEAVKTEEVVSSEIEKLQNTFATSHAFSCTSSLHKAMNLAHYENLGNANLLNTEIEEYMRVSEEDLKREAKTIFRPENASIVTYEPAK